ncbi:hypothetical protein BDV96DRAFT_644579 [Lophiotrema nucula]|uniref:Uncharacterized protein n=1 Tax=Lophiotrema nucula TaxID=690887 RepID=A0A6A5ZD56_9PLEO|nr:hypothetical protein BDV96DRAFT_644579 [Lophiotrema nucula]
MEPASLAASILTLISASSATASVVGRLLALRERPRYLDPALNEITDFTAMLAVVHRTLEPAGESLAEDVRVELQQLLDRAKQRIDAFKDFLERKLLKGGQSKTTKPKLRPPAKFREILGQNKAEVDLFLQELASIKLNLGIVLNRIDSRRLQHVHTLLMGIESVSLIKPNEWGVISSPASDNWISTTSALESAASNVLLPATNGTTAGGRQAHLIPSTRGVHDLDSYVMVETRDIRRTCTSKCLCQCHVPFQGSTPRWLQGLVGSMFCRFVGTPLLNHRLCNVLRCSQKKSQGAVHFQYFFPGWFLPYGILVSGTWDGLMGAGATWTLKIPRFVDQNLSGRFLYIIQNHTVEHLRRFMAEYTIRAFDVDVYGTHILQIALNNWRGDVCNMLLASGANLGTQNKDGLTLGQLFWKFSATVPESDLRFDAIKRLPEVEEELDNMDWTPLHKIILGHSTQNFKAQLELDPTRLDHKDSLGFTPLHWAVRLNDTDAIDVLLEAGADVNVVCREGTSILSYASTHGFVPICQKLLEHGADIHSRCLMGRNALYYALCSGPAKHELITFLLHSGANINNRDSESLMTCLMLSIQYQPFDITAILLKYGANIEEVDYSGNTAIFYSVIYNKPDTLHLLLDRGANPNHVNNTGGSLIHYATVYATIELMEILREVHICGLRTDPEALNEYRYYFDHFRDPSLRPYLVEENADDAFAALLDSLVPDTNTRPRELSKYKQIPGAFPQDPEDTEHSENESEDEHDLEDESEEYSDVESAGSEGEVEEGNDDPSLE